LELGGGSPVQVDYGPSIELAHGSSTADISARARPQDREALGFENQRRCPRPCAADAQARTMSHRVHIPRRRFVLLELIASNLYMASALFTLKAMFWVNWQEPAFLKPL